MLAVTLRANLPLGLSMVVLLRVFAPHDRRGLLWWGSAGALSAVAWVIGRLTGQFDDFYSWLSALAPGLAMIMVFSIGALVVTVRLLPRARRLSAVAAALVCATLLIVGEVRNVAIAIVRQPIAEDRGRENWMELQRWAYQHTPPGSLFLVPFVYYGGFENFAERPAVISWEYVGFSMYYPSYLATELDLLRRVGFDLSPPQRPPTDSSGEWEGHRRMRAAQAQFAHASDEELLQKARELNVRYMAFTADYHKDTRLPVVYDGAGFRVLQTAD